MHLDGPRSQKSQLPVMFLQLLSQEHFCMYEQFVCTGKCSTNIF